MEIWSKYRVTIQFLPPDEGGRYMGGVPAHPGLIEDWLAAQGREGVELEQEVIEDVTAQAEASGKEQILKVTTTFYKDGQGIYLPSHIWHGVLKEAVRGLGLAKARRGIITAASLQVTIKPFKLYVGKEKADGVEEFASRVQTQRGPRSILRRKEWLDLSEKPLTHILQIVKGSLLDDVDLLRSLYVYAGERGMGSGRAIGEGKFNLLEIVKIDA